MSATFYDDPNRESVGLEPIWTGAGDPPPPEGEGQPAADATETKRTVKHKTTKDTDEE